MAGETPAKITIAAVDKTTEVIERLKAKFPQLQKAVDRSNQSFKNFQASTAAWTTAANRIGKPMQQVGKVLTAAVTLPALAAGAYSLKAFTDYESALVGVGKTADVEGPALEALGKQFVDLSKRVPSTAVELLELAKISAQLGVKRPDLLKFTETMSMLASATNIVGEEGATDLARFIKVTKGSIGDADRFGSAIVELGNKTGTTESEILSFATRLGATTALFNLTGDQVLGISATLRSLGLEAEASSSALQRTFGTINETISKGGQKMEVLSKLTGIAGGELKKQFKTNAVGVLRDFAAGLDRVQKNGGDVTQVLSYFGMEGVRDIQVLGTLSQQVAALDTNLGYSKNAFGANLALAEEFNRSLGTTANKTKMTWNQVSALAIELGKQLAPAFHWVLRQVSALASFFEAHPFLAKTTIVVVGLVAALGPLLMIIGSLITAVPGAIALFSLFTGTLIPFATAAWAAIAPFLIAAAPFIAIGVAIVALIAVIVIFRKEIGDFLVKAFNLAIEKALAFWDVLKSIGSDMASVFGFGDNNTVTVKSKMNPLGPGGVPMLGPQGAPTGALDTQSRSNSEFFTQTNNARVDINVRAPQSTTVRSESNGGFMSINRGLAGAW